MSKDTNAIEWSLVGNEIHRSHKGANLVVGTFEDGHLEFNSEDMEKKYRAGAVTFVESEEANGGIGQAVKSFGLKGKESKVKEDAPDMPKPNPTLGDMDPKLVQWYYDNDRVQFDVRYGVIKDQNGKYQKVCCRRERWDYIRLDPKNSDSKEWVKSWEVKKGMILARRGTNLTASQETVISEEEYNNYVERGEVVAAGTEE